MAIIRRSNKEFEALMGAIQGIQTEVASIRADVDALKSKTATELKSAKSAPKKATKTTAKQTAKTTSTKTGKKSSAKKTATKTAKVEVKAISTKLADFEPCTFKDSGNYVWGGARGYKAMRSAYCYAKQTKGQARNLADAKKLGFEIDFDKAWNKAKAEFEKKYVYVKAEDRA